MKKYTIVIITLIVIAISFLIFLIASGKKAQEEYIAKINGISIPVAKFNQELAKRRQFYSQANQKKVELRVLERDVIGSLVDGELVSQYAAKNNITVSEKETAEFYRRMVKQSGFSEEGYLARIRKMYGNNQAEHLQKIKEELTKQKVQNKLGMPLADWLIKEKNTAQIEIRQLPSAGK